MRVSGLAACILPVVTAALACGCGGGGHSGGGGGFSAVTGSTDPQQFASMTAQGTNAATALAVQAMLHAVDPGAFQALQGTSPSVAVTFVGTTSGSVTLDFGSGTTVNHATFSGQVVASWTNLISHNSQGSANLTIAFQGFAFTTGLLGHTTVSGSWDLSQFAWNGTQAGANSSSSVQATPGSGGGPFDVNASSFAWTFANSGVETITISDTVDVIGAPGDDGQVEFASVQMTFVGSSRSIVSGQVVTARDFVTCVDTFDAPDAATVVTSPPGTTSTIQF